MPAGGTTTVTWRLEGKNGFVGKAFSLVMDMDEMVGSQFEKGLAKLKTAGRGDGGAGVVTFRKGSGLEL